MSKEQNIILLSRMLEHEDLEKLFEHLWFDSCKRDVALFKTALQLLVIYTLKSPGLDEKLSAQGDMDDLEIVQYKLAVAEAGMDDEAMMEVARQLSELLDSRDTTFTVV